MISRKTPGHLCLLSLTCIFSLKPCHGEIRDFTSADGRKIKAEILNIKDGTITMKRDDDQEFTITADRFSTVDQEFFKSWKPTPDAVGDAESPINKALNHPLFNDKKLFDRKGEDIAKILNIPVESITKHSSSWRLYSLLLKEPYTLFGANPHTISMYADKNGNFTTLSAVYANKGDHGSNVGFAEDHQKQVSDSKPKKNLTEAMLDDVNAITKVLNDAIGKGTEQRFGEGEMRRSVTRWDYQGHAIILSVEEREFVGVSITSTEIANNKGKTERVQDSILVSRLASCVKKEANGDVLITNIPMVDQGPKGYCVPATFERAMRHMSIDADMYLLAMAGNTSSGGGTNPIRLIETIKTQIHAKGRRTRDIECEKLELKDVKKLIDEGVPVMWTLYSNPLFNEIANERSKQRKETKDWSKWKLELDGKYFSNIEKLKIPIGPHINMIIGYNEKTNEVAISDSWGSEYEVRWVRFEEANAVNLGLMFAILP